MRTAPFNAVGGAASIALAVVVLTGPSHAEPGSDTVTSDVVAPWISAAAQDATPAAPAPVPWDTADALPPLVEIDTPDASACQATDACWRRGLCTPSGGACIAGSDRDCESSELCNLGRCSARGGRCVIASSTDCERTSGCALNGRCFAQDGRCLRSDGSGEDEPIAPFISKDRDAALARAGAILTFAGLGTAGLGGLVLGLSADDSSSDGSGYGSAFGSGLLALGGVAMLTMAPGGLHARWAF